MEIKNDIGQLNPYQARLDKAQGAEQSARSAKHGSHAEGSRAGDKVTFSPEAKLLVEANNAATSAEDVRLSRVDAIKAKIESGEYHVDSRQLASRLLQEEPGLFSK